MIELIILRHLQDKIAVVKEGNDVRDTYNFEVDLSKNSEVTVPIYLEKQDRELPYVLIEKTSSSKTNHLPEATFAFQSYDTSLYKTVELNEKVKEVLETLIELDEIRGITLNSDYNFTDTTTKEYRYQAVYDIRYY